MSSWLLFAFSVLTPSGSADELQRLELRREAVKIYNQAVANPELSPEERLALYEQALILNPRLQPAYVNRAMILLSLGKSAQALHELNTAIELDSGDTLAWNNRAGIYELLKDYGKAINDYEHAVLLDETFVTPYLGIGHCHQKMKHYSSAIQSYSRAIQVNPQDFDARRDRALAYLKTLNADLALEDIRAALELRPEDEEMQEFLRAATELKSILNGPKKTREEKMRFLQTLRGD